MLGPFAVPGWRITRTLVLAGVQIGCIAQESVGHDPKIAADLAERHSGALVDVIVQYKPEAYERISSAPPIEHHRTRGLAKRVALRSIHAQLLSVRAEELEEIAADPDVEFISPDRQVHA